MPTYDYKCLECNYTFEEFQKMTDDHLETCPECNGKIKRLIGSGAAPIFKGSGFYQTDYKNSSKNEKSQKSENITAKKTEPPKTEAKTDKAT